MRNALLLFALAAAAAACDTKAKASDPAAHAESKSKEYESCDKSASCDGELRCFAQECRRTARSTVGDYYAAVGARGGSGAIAAYATALDQYKTEKIAPPPEIDCGYGEALARDVASAEHAELGARVLHRCILGVPVGSALRDRALAALATLGPAGLNPLALGGTGPADRYMTGSGAPPPPASPAGVTVTASPQPAGKSFQAVLDKLAEPDTKAGLVACASTYTASTKKDTLVAVVGVKAAFVPSQYDDEDGHFTIAVDPPTTLPAGTPEAAADTCVHSVVDPAIKGLTTVHDNFATKLTLTIK